MNVFISSSCSQKKTIFDALEELALVGFRNIELSGGNVFDTYEKKGLLQLCEQLKLTLIVHNYFPPQAESFVLNVASADPHTVYCSQILVNQAVELSQELQQKHYGIHAGYVHEMSTECDKDGIFLSLNGIADSVILQQKFIANMLERLPQDFYLAIENAFPRSDGTPISLLATPEEILAHVEFYKDSPVGLLLDLGHLGVCAHVLKFDKYAFLNTLFSLWRHRIFELHLSTHQEGVDTHNVTSSDSPDVAFLAQYRKDLNDMPLVLEWQRIDCKDAYKAYQKLLPFLS